MYSRTEIKKQIDKAIMFQDLKFSVIAFSMIEFNKLKIK